MEAVLYRYRADIAWCDLPSHYGHGKTVSPRFSRWSARGVWKRLFEHLAGDADYDDAMINSTMIRAHQHSAGVLKNQEDPAIGRSKGGLSTKIHATTP